MSLTPWNKLYDLKTAPKINCKILKTFTIHSKIPLIPPLLVGNQLVTEFSVKVNLFNDYFSQQYSKIDSNDSISASITVKTQE